MNNEQISEDIRCECGHVFQDHLWIGGEDSHESCAGNTGNERECDCTEFNAAEVQNFCGHPFSPIQKRDGEEAERNLTAALQESEKSPNAGEFKQMRVNSMLGTMQI